MRGFKPMFLRGKGSLCNEDGRCVNAKDLKEGSATNASSCVCLCLHKQAAPNSSILPCFW